MSFAVAAGKRALPAVDALWYVSQPLASTYRAIIQVFADARDDAFTLELSEPELYGLVAGGRYASEVDGEAGLRIRLDELHEHGNLTRRQDERAQTLDDLTRRRYRWQLTSVGQAAHQAVEAVESSLGQSGSLQVTMLTRIRDALERLGAGGPTPSGAFGELSALFGAQDQFVTEAQRYMTSVNERHALSVGAVTDEEFRAHKEAVKLYITRFLHDLTRLAPDIEVLLRSLDGEPIERLVGLAATSPDLPPADDAADPAAEWAARARTRWQGLYGWFLTTGGRPAGLDGLRSATLRAVMSLTRALTRLNAARGGAATLGAAFLQAARWMAQADSAEAHRLFNTFTGLYPARHLSIAEDDPELTSQSTSWWDATPADVPVSIVRHNRSGTSGRAARARETHQEKQFLRARRRRQREQARAALATLATGGPCRLSTLAALSRPEFDLLLELLNDALAAPLVGGARRVTSGASGVEVALTPPTDGARATVEVADGRFEGPDYGVAITVPDEATHAGDQASGAS